MPTGCARARESRGSVARRVPVAVPAGGRHAVAAAPPPPLVSVAAWGARRASAGAPPATPRRPASTGVAKSRRGQRGAQLLSVCQREPLKPKLQFLRAGDARVVRRTAVTVTTKGIGSEATKLPTVNPPPAAHCICKRASIHTTEIHTIFVRPDSSGSVGPNIGKRACVLSYEIV